MGTNSSKNDRRTSFDRTDNRRLSKRRLSKVENIESIIGFVQILKSEIEIYTGFRHDDRYKTIQMLLAKHSQDVHILRTKKDKNNLTDYAQREINLCLRMLEDKVIQNEKALDVAAVESHSFINQNVKPTTSNNKRTIQEQKINKSFNTLDNIEEGVNKLQGEINKLISSDFNKQTLVILEKKIHILYTDLEMIAAEPHTPLHERKEYIGRQLVKFNNKIKKAKQSNSRKSTMSLDDRASFAFNTSRELINSINTDLKTLEIQVATFNDTKNSETFKKIKEDLNKYWHKLHDMKNDEDSIKKSKLNLTEKVKYILNNLKEQAHKNEINLEIDKGRLRSIGEDVGNFKMGDNKENYEVVLKKLAERVKKIGDFEEVQKDKEKLLEELEELHQDCENNKNRNADSLDNMQNKKTKSIINKLYSSIEDLTALNSNKPIVAVLEAFRDDINEKLKALKNEDKENPEPVYAIPFKADKEKEDKIQTTSSIDNILESIEIVETEFNTARKKAIEQQQVQIRQTNENPRKIQATPIHSVMDVDVQVQHLSKEIGNFQSNKEDIQYAQIRNSLNACSSTLNEIPNGDNESVLSAKREIQTQIDHLHVNLDAKLTENKKSDLGDVEQIKTIIKDVKRLKKSIDCFNGLHKSTLYMHIEDNLNLSEQKLNEFSPNINHEKLKILVQDVISKIKQYKKILDEKSIKVTTDHGKNRQSVTYDSYKQLEEIRNQLLTIKAKMEMYNGTKRQDDFNKICAELMKCNEQLDSIPDMNSKSIKTSKEQYTDYVKELLKYFEEKTSST